MTRAEALQKQLETAQQITHIGSKPLGRGTGLGLPSVQRFASESGGTVAVHGELNHGTAVVLYLPRLP